MPRKPQAPAVEVITMAKQPVQKPKTRDGVYKVCSECGKEQPVANFYSNRRYRLQMGYDRWCKNCIKESCVDEKSFRNYLYQNNRMWKPELWREAMKTATRDMNLSMEFSRITDPEEQQREIEKRAVVCACAIMNKPAYYKYVDNESRGFEVDIDKHVDAEKDAERDSDDPYYSLPIYSPKWKGTYTQAEIDAMDTYLDRIIQARGVEDDIGLDYAMKFVSQSALVDKLTSAARKNQIKENLTALKDASATLETLSRAANIAPAYKKSDTTVGLGSLGLFIKAMENGNMLGSTPSFPDDQIDGIVKDFRHTVQSIEGAGGLWSQENG